MIEVNKGTVPITAHWHFQPKKLFSIPPKFYRRRLYSLAYLSVPNLLHSFEEGNVGKKINGQETEPRGSRFTFY